MNKLKQEPKKIELNPNAAVPEKVIDYSIKVSVRQLVEFVLRTGDIDNRRISGAESAMLQGSKLHRMIQKRMGDNYYPEVLLKYQYETSRYNIEIEGRADGIIINPKDDPDILALPGKQVSLNQYLTIEEYDDVTIDEIKCMAKDLQYLNAPVPVHLAQAKVYAFIYAKQNNLPFIRVRMSYCHMETEEMKYFDFEYAFSEISEWFEDLMKQYIKWADFQYDWHFIRQASIKQLDFPFEYRDGQKQLAIYVYKTIMQSKKLYLEAPTGVGKTISTIFPAVKAMGEGLLEKIFYLTAKTITRTVAEDTYDILREKALQIKSVTLTAKDKICIYEKANCNPVACERANGHFDRVNDAIYEAITHYDRIDRGVIEEVAEKYMVCPFELGLDISMFADTIICDYNYVFDPHACLKRYFSDGMKGDYAFLIDEAHNLVDRGRSMFSAQLHKEDFLTLKREINMALEKQTFDKIFKKPSLALRLSKALERCNKEMLAIKRVCDDCIVLEDIDRFAGLVESLHTVMDQFLEEESESEIREKVLEFYFEVCHFLLIYERFDKNYLIYAELPESGSFKVKLFCVNPSENLKEAMAKGRSSILFSATLLPIQYYKKLLGGTENDYEAYAKSTFDNNKRGLFIANDVTSKYSRRNKMEYYKIASYIYEIVKVRPGNYMVFFPSHAFLASVYEQFATTFLDTSSMDCVLQEEHMSEEMREQFLNLFEGKLEGLTIEDKTQEKNSSRTLIGFCVLGGIFSEGIDLKNDSLIGAIIVGTGLPLVCNERELLKDFFDDESSSGFDYAYSYPGMNKVLQAAGRVIRTADDVGVVALLDERFNSTFNKRLFPREWENAKVVNNRTIAQEVDDFWNVQNN